MTGERILRRVLSLCMALMAWTSPLGAKAGPVTCPWEEKDLYLWSDPATWDSGIVPQDNDEVSVTKRVLLDTQPSSLANLTIQPGAALIWGNVPDLVLRATYIRVLGEFHIGSDACRFQQKATIKLYGTADSPYEVEHFGRKFLGVGSGGALELHGADKMSWSKLAHTVYAFSPDINCSFVYDHKTATYGAETLSGVHMIIWNQDGTVFDFEIFDSTNWNTLPTFLDVPDGLVVAASVRKDLGVPTATFYDTMESLGAQSIRDVAPTQMYAFIVKKGDISTAAERLADVDEPDTGYLHFPDYVRDLDFSVTSTSSDVDFRVLNGDVAFPIISVAHDVSSWQPGDEVVVTSSDYDWRQAEVRRVLACSTCTASQIRLDGADVMHTWQRHETAAGSEIRRAAS
nr:hypothetical protein BaRGS_013055 [Batillaria attramentaria]